MHPPTPISGEDGVALVTVALWLPLLVLFASFTIDVGNWFLHDRHLQLQADAGALAAAGDFSFPCDDAEIEATARQYSGTAAEGTVYNQQVGGTPPEQVHFELNSPTYFGQAAPVDETVAGPPCEAGMVDVKLTETDLPLFLRVADLFARVPFINAHARVEIFKQRNVVGALPVAVPDTNPRKARVTFFELDANLDPVGGPIASTELFKSESGSGGELAIWDNAEIPLPLPVESERIGMTVALSGGDSTTCGEPLVECYEDILFVRGYGTSGSGAQPSPPLARDAYLIAGACDPYFSSEKAGCSVGLHAEVDFGPCGEIGEVGPELTAVVGGTDYPLAMTGCPEGTSASSWETSGAPIPVPAGAGPVPVELEWAETEGEVSEDECKEGGGNKCTGSFGVVQRSFAGDNGLSGPIREAQIWEGGAAWANSFERCSIEAETCPGVVARIGVDLNLLEAADDVDEPPVTLRASGEDAESNASQTQALDCDPDVPNLKEEIAYGCAPEYTLNTGTACPAPNDLEVSPQPWECVAVKTGGATGQVYPGMNLRVHGAEDPSECVNPNNWGDYPPGDPRILPLFITPFGSFAGSGADETVPITDFAIFYVTGWASEGGGKTSQEDCPGDDLAGKGEIVGHFIQYVQAFNDGSASEETCDFESTTSITPCVAVLTK